MTDKYEKTVNEYKTVPRAGALMKNAIKEIIPDKSNWVVWVISMIVAAVLSIIVGYHNNTVEVFKRFVQIILDFEIAVFGILFAVYSVLLSFLNKGFIKLLADCERVNGKSMLMKSTEYYENVLFLYFIGIVISLIVTLFMDCVPEDYRLTSSYVLDSALASLLIFGFLLMSFRIVCEIKSTLYNTIVLFRTNMACRFLEFDEEEKDN